MSDFEALAKQMAAQHEQGRAAIDFDAIPAAMRERRQWLMWRLELEEGDKKPRKVPYYANGRRRRGDQGSDADRADLVDFVSARAMFQRHERWSGIGFAFLPGSGMVGIDLDGMFDAETGELAPRARQILDAVPTFTEISPSGRGLHLYALGETRNEKSNKIGVEVFCTSQFFTVTGRAFSGAPPEVEAISPAALDLLHAMLAEAKKKPAASTAPAAPRGQSRDGDDPRKLASALPFIDPGCGYDEWLQVGMAIHDALGPGGLSVWDHWSSGAASYPGVSVLEAHWKSFKPGGGITAATIYRRALQAGWRPPRPAAQPRAAHSNDSRVARPHAPPPDSDFSAECDSDFSPPAPDPALAQLEQGVGGSSGGDAEGGAKKKRRKKAPPEQPEKLMEEWWPRLVKRRGEVVSCLSNVYDILLYSPDWGGVLAFDEFAQKIIKLTPPPFDGGEAGDWSDTDAISTAMWISRMYYLTPSDEMVDKAISALAKRQRVHPVRDWLRGLVWDGVPRLDDWMAKYLGVADTPYSRLVSRWFPLGMVMRILQPGVKFDCCLVLEGGQGPGKTTALSVLGGDWFSNTDIDLSNKDALEALRGVWLYEFGELGGLTKAETSKTKSFLSRQHDDFRPVYGRRAIRLLRQTAFSASTNEWEWQKDPTGGRRFWPVEVGDIDLDGLRAVRDQLFAEAIVAADAGEQFWPSREQQRLLFDPEQLKREQPDSLVDALEDWVSRQVVPFSIAMAVMDGLRMDASKLTRDVQTRVGIALRKLKCRRVEKKSMATRYWYEAPPRTELLAPGAEKIEVPF